MRIALPLACLLAACSAERVPDAFNAQAKADQQAAKERLVESRAIRAGFAPGQPQPLETVSVDPPKTPRPGAILPPASEQYRYIGRWAQRAGLCATGAWRFETRKLSVGDNIRCDLPEVAAVPTGYELTGTCRGQGKPTEQTLKLSFDEQRRTMRAVGVALGPTDLIYCGD